MALRSMKVTLRREKKIVSSATLSQGSDPVLVGRAKECSFRIPSDDYSASGVHAKIYWKGTSLVLEDVGSRNGIFRDGALVKGSVKLVPGSIYAIGSCLLTVENLARTRSRAHRQFHRIEFLNGEHAGRILDIVPHQDGKDFDIGLDPACSVHLNDLLVSRRHAALRTHDDGECWIEDLGSRNGTFVNGERLSGKERLLKDGDKVSVAFFDFRFLDRKVAHTRVQAWFKLGVVSVTFCVMAALYVAWTASRQSVDSYMIIARQAASRGDFDSAQAAVDASRNARDARERRAQIDTLVSQVALWRKTSRNWKEIQNDIATNNLKVARFKLDNLASGPIESWAWDPERASEVKNEVDFAVRALRLYFDGYEAIAVASKDMKPDADLSVRAAIGPIESFLRSNLKIGGDRGYMTGVLDRIDELLTSLRKIRSGYDEIDASIAKISGDRPDFNEIYADFGKIASNTSLPPAVCGYARQQLSPCAAFVKAQEFLDQELALLLKLDFSGVRKIEGDFQLPSRDLCIRHARLSDARMVFEARHKMLQHESAALQLIIDGLSSAGITIDSRGDDIDMFLNQSNIVKALEFDCFNRRPPNARRENPVGKYDTMFGIEYCYECLRSLPKPFNGRNMRTMGFSPKCIAARQAFDRAETFVQYLDNEDRQYLQRGDLGRYYTHCVRITTDREKMVQRLKDFRGSERAEIVAGYFADFFSPNPTDVAKRTLKLRFDRLRKEMITLGERYSLEVDPEKQLAIREEILSKGIPCDPVVQPKWAQKYD